MFFYPAQSVKPAIEHGSYFIDHPLTHKGPKSIPHLFLYSALGIEQLSNQSRKQCKQDEPDVNRNSRRYCYYDISAVYTFCQSFAAPCKIYPWPVSAVTKASPTLAPCFEKLMYLCGLNFSRQPVAMGCCIFTNLNQTDRKRFG